MYNIAMNREIPRTPKNKREYKEVVEQIRDLNWKNLDGAELQQLMYLSHVSAREFAEALRLVLQLYPENANLKEMAEGELQATNLSFEDYNQTGDHADFLAHFLKKYDLEGDENLEKHAKAYRQACQALDDKIRAMTIFSREEELSGIFKGILEAKDWTAEGLPAFRYYLGRHIALDSGEGGHAELTKEFPIDDNVKSFYEARLEMYRAIPKLFEKKS
jgi:hypothetical protein